MTSNMQRDDAPRTQAKYSHFGTGDQRINSGPGNQYNYTFSTKKNDSFLADLRVTDPRDDKTRIERTRGGLLTNSYRWILDHNDFRRWRTQNRLLWIRGGPGKGKTMLLCGVIDELVAMGYESVFFFFCQATDARLNTATSVLRGLLYLVLCQRPSLISLFRDKHDHAGKQLFEDANSWDVLCEMLMITLRHESLYDVVLVIDALDECTSGLDQLLKFVIELSTDAKIIVSSRNWPSIDRGLAAATENTKIYMALELNEQAISAAVDNYIHHKVNELANQKAYDDKTKNEVYTHLATNANSTFLWVALVCQQLENNRVSTRHTRNKLQEFPPGLDSLYEKILNHILGLPDANTCTQILTFMSIVSRPLNLTELASLLGPVDSLEEIVKECGSLLTVKGNVVYFVHQSAKDFLLGQNNKVMPLNVGQNHNLVLSKLLQIMSNTLLRNIYNLKSHGTLIDEIRVPNPDPLASARYACVYWADHFIKGHIGQQQYIQVYTFLKEHFVYWLEALSLLRSISEGISSISNLMQIIETSAESLQQKNLVRDAMRFIRYFRTPIEIDPLQVYYSALVFSPTRSIIRGLFQFEEPAWIMTRVVDEDWSPCLQTLEGHEGWVNSVDFSPDKATLASASDDGTVKLWNTTTGRCVQTLTPCSGQWVASVAFSSDGVTLASASSSAIQLWNTTTGQCVKRLSGRGQCTSVAFSSDGVTLASSSTDCTIQLWDTKSGQCTHTLEGHRRMVSAVAFSGDGSLVASASDDETVKLWQAATGTCLRTMNHLYQVASVDFSRDDTQLVSVSLTEVKLWSPRTGDCLETLKDMKTLQTVAFSPDGTQLALDWGHGSITLWDITASQSKHILMGHHGNVKSVKFSEDGKLLASASTDASIKLWDVTGHRLGEPLHPPAPSPDIRSVSRPRQIRSSRRILRAISNALPSGWTRRQTPTGTLTGSMATSQSVQTRPMNQHKDCIYSLSFSSDGSRLLSVSSKTTCVWDTKTGLCLQTMNEGGEIRCCATLQNDKVYIAECYRGERLANRIRIKDVTTGLHLQTLAVYRSVTGSMVFSRRHYTGIGLGLQYHSFYR